MKGTTFLRRQYRRVEQLLDAVEGERYVRAALLAELADDLSATLRVEEAIFFPAAREVLGAATEEDYAEHAKATRGLRRLFAALDDTPRFLGELDRLRALVSAHFAREERCLLPSLEQALSEGELEHLGLQMQRLHRTMMDADEEPQSDATERPSRDDWHARGLDFDERLTGERESPEPHAR